LNFVGFLIATLGVIEHQFNSLLKTQLPVIATTHDAGGFEQPFKITESGTSEIGIFKQVTFYVQTLRAACKLLSC